MQRGIEYLDASEVAELLTAIAAVMAAVMAANKQCGTYTTLEKVLVNKAIELTKSIQS